MRRLNPARARARAAEDGGTVATLVALLMSSGVLLGVAALTVDVGLLYAERRQLQNGADAGALAVALDCAVNPTCDTSPSGQARDLADANADDGAGAVGTICGSGHPDLPACPTTSGSTLADCPAPPTGVTGWVEVRTATETADGATLMPAAFARALAGSEDQPGARVGSCAQAAWGAPATATGAAPIIFSLCEWDAATSGGVSYAPPPPYPPYPAAAEVALALHSTTDDGTCPSAGGAYADLPGGFGWLDGGGDCQVEVTAGSTVAARPGVSAGGCGDEVTSRVGEVIYLPIFSDAWGNGANGTYRVAGIAAFYLSGYALPGAHPRRVDSPVGGRLCTGSAHCLYGWFTQALIPGGGPIGPGPDLGAHVVAMAG